MDTNHPRWSLNACDNLYDKVILKLKNYEGMPWRQIIAASGGRSSGTNNHYEDVADLTKEARDRMTEIHIEEDRIFSLRLTSMERLYGILDGNVFFVIWYDAKHEIYPTSK